MYVSITINTYQILLFSHCCVQLFVNLWTVARQASLSFTISRVYSRSYPLSQWCLPTISSSVTPFSSCPQSFQASGSFPRSQLFASDGLSIGALTSASVLSVNIQGWFPLGLTDLISLQFRGLSRVFSSTTAWKHQFFDLFSLFFLLAVLCGL